MLVEIEPILLNPMFHTWKKKDLIKALNNAPRIDPIHAVEGCYCRECINFTQIDFNWGLCRHHDSDMEVNGFCSCGKLKGVYDDESD